MTETRQPIVVGFDGTAGSAAAVEWALVEARSRHLPLRLITGYELDLDYPWLLAYNEVATEERAARNNYQQLVSNHVAEIRQAATDVPVTGTALEGSPSDILCAESGRAELIVVGHRNRRGVGPILLGSVAADVVAGARCPVVVLRDLPPAHDGGVVAGVDGGPTSHAVLEFAFDFASRRGLGLSAVLCLPPTIGRSATGDGAALDRARRWLSEATAGWREKYPDVTVSPSVVSDHTVDGLTEAAVGQRLLVVGVNRKHHRIGALLGSVANGLLHHAPCPVAAVPVFPDEAER